MLRFATKTDIANLMVTDKDELVAALKIIYDTPDDTCYRVVSGSEENGDIVFEEVSASNPVWKQKGFSSRAEIKDFIGDYSDENLNLAKTKKIQEHQNHIVQLMAAYNMKISKEKQFVIDALINQKMKDNAIEALKKEGKLTVDGKIPK